MNRRSFLKWMGVGVAGVVVAPSVLLSEGPACVAPDAGFATIAAYEDYANFSSFSLAAAIDTHVLQAAKELGKAHERRIFSLRG